MIEGEEVKDMSTLARVKSVDDMIPKPADNQLSKGNNARIWEEQYKIIESYLMMDATVEVACMAAWISVPSYYHHREINPDFARRMDIAKQYPKVVARAAIMRRIRQGDAKTALDYLRLTDRQFGSVVSVDTWESKAPVVQFISVASNEWAGNTTNNDSQTDTKPSYASDWYVSSWEAEKMTSRENEEQILSNIDSLTSNSD